MKKQRIYLDTSVFGGYFDDEFQEFTKPLFERIRNGEFIIIFSTILETELEFAPEKVRELVRKIENKDTEFVEETDNAVELATEYIMENVVGKTRVILTVYVLPSFLCNQIQSRVYVFLKACRALILYTAVWS